MEHDDATTRKLNQLLDEHPELKKLALNDATVYSWIKTAMTYDNREYVADVTEILVGIIVMLGKEKQTLFDSAVEHAKICTTTREQILGKL